MKCTWNTHTRAPAHTHTHATYVMWHISVIIIILGIFCAIQTDQYSKCTRTHTLTWFWHVISLSSNLIAYFLQRLTHRLRCYSSRLVHWDARQIYTHTQTHNMDESVGMHTSSTRALARQHGQKAPPSQCQLPTYGAAEKKVDAADEKANTHTSGEPDKMLLTLFLFSCSIKHHY